ncbi:carboxypeptidase regulatory region-containingprotein, putative [Ricinus communis]|uniref:Carboxypeptidase regulatory region-containingprotein, putative n=1 Tax=Ricinus communis TaxID=3988 RepID=B9RNC2_RICCO|nr:carboxypeptidase regulatory region-containingprotein, putative [Ricinus communis]|eukprot:XP_002515261.1 nodal modulator 1 [Ricinus communis]
MKIRDALLYFSILLYSFSFASADSIHGCGGFVEASSSLIKSRKSTDTKLDYSDITVELRTVDGLVKERTQCAPNGYYFIPVYDKGSFVIKISGPEGWSWDPESVPVIVDDTGCNHNEDINFRFTGFTLSGRVMGAVGGESCLVKSGGPSNVNVELLSPSDDFISSVLTSATGSYSFNNIIPGKYKIRASHPDLKVEVKGSTEVHLGFENGIVDDIFFVPGYDLHGYVVAQGNPILGVHIFLYSEDVVELDCPQGSGDATGQRNPLCHAISDADGMFSFKSLPCGRYELVPYYKGENTLFDVSPPLVSVSVEHQHVTVPQKFQVTGFSVGGRVADGNDMGVEGVKIIVDGHERSMTDKEGYYKLDQVTSNHYTIEARKEHYRFNSLKEYMVLPNMASVADIKAISYDVCGVVRMVNSGYKAKVTLTHGPENVKPQARQTDGDGKFCFEVAPGEYRLSAFAATPESAPGLLFLPPYVDLVVKSPLMNVEFSQALVNVLGSVTCKEKCGPSVSVTLMRLGGKRNEERKSITLTDESDEFLFANVLPGKYRIEVKHSSHGATPDKDNWCWEQSFIDVVVGAEDVKGNLFVQKGYWVNVVSTHDIDAYLTQPDHSIINLKIKKGSQHICVESPGVHELHFINSCILFASSPMKIDTSNPSPVYLRGEKYLLKGQIKVELSSADGLYEPPNNFVVDILNGDSSVIDGASANLASGASDHTSTGIYEYSIWANLGEKLTFVPRDSRVNGEKRILFYPKEHNVLVANDGCQASIPVFSGRPGLYIEGSVSPPLSGVYIKISAAEDSHVTLLKKDDLALETVTGMDGSFVGGPLYDDISYSVEASKPGYHLKRMGPHSFSCQKLGQISIHIYSKDDANEPIPSVLLSLSGDDGYRNNSVSGAGGTFLFDNLFPGTFYLRPLLKEYAFSPPAQAIELGSGDTREVTFEATRVAYSATGMITLLSGQPKEGVSVEARSESKGYYEETVTDSSGNYRLRGLVPDTTYVIKVVEKHGLGSAFERASPESYTVKVGHGDIKALDFVVFEQLEMTILSCNVEGKRTEEFHSHLLVEIKSASDTSKIESVFPLPLSNFFQVKNLPKGKHLLQLRSSLQSSTLKFESDIIEVDLEKTAQIHVGPLRYNFEEDHQKQELTVAPVLPLVVGVSVIALFISMPRLKDLYQSTTGIPTPGFVTTAKKETRKPVVRKKTY